MKLHLPLRLLTSLMAVLTTTYVNAAATLHMGEQDVSDEIPYIGEMDISSYGQVDMTLRLDSSSSPNFINNVTLKGAHSGNADIFVGKGASLVMKNNFANGKTAKVEVDGGEFLAEGIIGKTLDLKVTNEGRFTSTLTEAMGAGATFTLNMDSGEVNLQGTNTLRNGSTISIKQSGGLFNSKAYFCGTATQALDLDIELSGDAVFNPHYIGSKNDGQTVVKPGSIDIDIRDQAVGNFAVLGSDMSSINITISGQGAYYGSANIGSTYKDIQSQADYNVRIEVKDEGTMSFTSGGIIGGFVTLSDKAVFHAALNTTSNAKIAMTVKGGELQNMNYFNGEMYIQIADGWQGNYGGELKLGDLGISDALVDGPSLAKEHSDAYKANQNSPDESWKNNLPTFGPRNFAITSVKSIQTGAGVTISGLPYQRNLLIQGAENYMTVGLDTISGDGVSDAVGNKWLFTFNPVLPNSNLSKPRVDPKYPLDRIYSKDNVFAVTGNMYYMISHMLVFDDDATLTLKWKVSDIMQLADSEGNCSITINLIKNGYLYIPEGEDALEYVSKHLLLDAGWSAQITDVENVLNYGSVTEADDVKTYLQLTISAKVSDIWIGSENAEADGTLHADAKELDSSSVVVIDQVVRLDMNDHDVTDALTSPSEVTLHQLTTGGDGKNAELNIIGDENVGSLVKIDNSKDVQGNQGNTVFNGNIVADMNVTLRKTGSESFTIQGALNTQGDLQVSEGAFVIAEASESSVAGGLSALEGELVVDGTLTLGGVSDLSEAGGSISGAGSLELQGSMTLNETASLTGVKLHLSDGKLDANGAQVEVSELAGRGALKGDISVVGGKGTFSGSLEDSVLTLKDAEQTFTGVQGATSAVETVGGVLTLQAGDAGSAYGSLRAEATTLRLEVHGGSDVQSIHVADSIALLSGAAVEFDVYFSGESFQKAAVTTDGVLRLGKGTVFRFNEVGKLRPSGDLLCYLISGVSDLTGKVEDVKLEFSSIFKLFYTNLHLETMATDDARGVAEGAPMLAAELPAAVTLALVGERKEESPLAAAARTQNALSGAGLLYAAALQSDEAWEEGTPLNETLTAALDLLDTNPAKASRVMAATAGSTVTALGAAQRDAMRGELMRLRYHAQHSSALSGKPELPLHTWVEANGSFSSMHTQGDMSGYRLNSWGGTVGASYAPVQGVSVGLAVSAQYGDLDASAADSAKGDLDGYYLSVFGHAKHHAWGHTLIATVGMHEAKLTRSVDYGSGSYTSRGKTDGSGFGARYELTYDVPLRNDGSSILQPLFGASIITSGMDSYSESGAGGASLQVDKQRWTTGSVDFGARWLGKVGKSLFGRSAQAELRANFSQDMGDSQGRVNTAMLAAPGSSFPVLGAKQGRTALQLGAGISLPVDTHTIIYSNVNADFRSGAHQWYVNAGVSVAF